MKVRLPNMVVYWAPLGFDNQGRPTWATPVQMAARWDDTVEETLGPKGDLVYSNATIILVTMVAVKGRLYLGLLTDLDASGFNTDPLSNENIREIVHVIRNPSLRATYNVIQALVK